MAIIKFDGNEKPGPKVGKLSKYDRYPRFVELNKTVDSVVEYIDSSVNTVSKVSIKDIDQESYTLKLEDANKFLRSSFPTASTITIPTDREQDFDIGTVITVQQLGAEQVTIASSVGVTLTFFGGLKTAGQYHGIQIIKVASNSWTMFAGVA